MPRVRNEKLIDPEDFQKIGEALGGTHWQADLARAVRCSKSFVTRAIDGSRKPDAALLERLRIEMLYRLKDIADLLETRGLPFAQKEQTMTAVIAIKQAIESMESQHSKETLGEVADNRTSERCDASSLASPP